MRQHRRQGGKRFKKPPHWLYPKAIEIRYRLYLENLAKKMQDGVRRILFPALPAMIADAENSRRTDAWDDMLEQAMEDLSVSFDETLADDAVRATLRGMADRINGWNTAQFHAMVKTVVGVEHYAYEPWLAPHMGSFVSENVGLIKKLKEETYQDINRIVQGGIRGGNSYRSIINEIVGTDIEPGRFTKTKDRARLIARDQIGKFNGELTSIRQQSIGVSEYYWRTAGDERVRDSHGALNGMLCRWDDDTVYSDDDGETWPPRSAIEAFEGSPGEDFQCRCWPEAKLTEPSTEEEADES
jgi:SPP1 gp7 family putative phage head morphogenesis protein